MQLKTTSSALGIFVTLAFALSAAQAQSTQAGIEAHLFKQELYLRDGRSDEDIRFDAQGNVLNPCPKGLTHCSEPFTLGGIDVTKVELKPDKLLLKGKRAWLEFQPQLKRISHRDSVTLEIAAPPNGDYIPALDNIFAYGLSDLTRSLPDIWQPYASKTFLHGVPAFPRSRPSPGSVQAARGVQPPRPLKEAPPVYTEAARAMTYKAMVVVNFKLGTDGKPHDMCIAQPAGLGLDEAAVAAVSQYVFKPATKDGQPLEVEINVEVSFPII